LAPQLPAPQAAAEPRAQCLYIGNGPSLNKLDWSFLNAAKLPVVMGARQVKLRCSSSHTAAGVNKIYLGFRRFNIRVNYLACTNRRSAREPARALLLRRNAAATRRCRRTQRGHDAARARPPQF
jgi:hypothetical protein